MTMITPSYLGETIEYSSLHACRSTLEDPTLPSLANVRSWQISRGFRPAVVHIARGETEQDVRRAVVRNDLVGVELVCGVRFEGSV